MYVSVERFEEDLAVLCDDSGNVQTVDKAFLPPQTKAGDLLRVENGAYIVDVDETAKRKNRIWQMEQLLRNRKKN